METRETNFAYCAKSKKRQLMLPSCISAFAAFHEGLHSREAMVHNSRLASCRKAFVISLESILMPRLCKAMQAIITGFLFSIRNVTTALAIIISRNCRIWCYMRCLLCEMRHRMFPGAVISDDRRPVN